VGTRKKRISVGSPDDLRLAVLSVARCAAREYSKFSREGGSPCSFLFENQYATFKRFFFPEPLFGDPSAPVLFIGINPQLNAECMAYDEGQLEAYCESIILRHRNLKLASKTGQWEERVCQYLNDGLGYGPRTFEEGGAIKINIAACRSTEWKPKKGQGDACADRCQGNLNSVLSYCHPQVVVAAGKHAYAWLRDLDLDTEVKDPGVVKFEGNLKENAGKMSAIKLRGEAVIGLATLPGWYQWFREEVLDEVVRLARRVTSRRGI